MIKEYLVDNFQLPAGADWVHEIKHDGYRLIVQRDGDAVRLFTRPAIRPASPAPVGAIMPNRPS
jgi:ATP-dependent DNA ligase